ncbi:hypothetical protein J1614_010548 [Plenodomus biglobosus]|nr:hypothetical protein J1614_010548 [Plenodomus biglobosus]
MEGVSSSMWERALQQIVIWRGRGWVDGPTNDGGCKRGLVARCDVKCSSMDGLKQRGNKGEERQESIPWNVSSSMLGALDCRCHFASLCGQVKGSGDVGLGQLFGWLAVLGSGPVAVEGRWQNPSAGGAGWRAPLGW